MDRTALTAPHAFTWINASTVGVKEQGERHRDKEAKKKKWVSGRRAVGGKEQRDEL